MREAFSNTLVEIALKDPRVILLTGDHGYGLFDKFRKVLPSQYINAGIAEQNMVGMAAGLARAGFRPIVYGLSAFIPIRVLEQIKIDIAHDNLPVILLGDGAGFVYSHLGTSHQSTEDIAVTRVIPGLDILSPCDKYEIIASMNLAYSLRKPVYLRMGKSDRGDVHQKEIKNLKVGKLLPIKSSHQKKCAIIATGSMVKTALNISSQFDASLWSAPSIKPLDKKLILNIAEDFETIITIEEHSIFGGMGSAITEIISEYVPRKILRIGVLDRFSQHCGSYEYLLNEHNLDEQSIIKKIRQFLRH